MLWEKEDEQDGYHTECDGIVARRAYSFVASVCVVKQWHPVRGAT